MGNFWSFEVFSFEFLVGKFFFKVKIIKGYLEVF